MQSGIPTDRPFLIPRGMGEELGASASHAFFDRSPEVFVGASSAPGSFPPPDNPVPSGCPDGYSPRRRKHVQALAHGLEGGRSFLKESRTSQRNFNSR